MQLTGGALALLAVLIPLSIKLARWSLDRGVHRFVASLALIAASIVPMGVAVASMINDWHPAVIAACAFAYALCICLAFTVDTGPIKRGEVVGFVLSMVSVPMLLIFAIRQMEHQTLKKLRAAAREERATPTPTASP